MKPQAIQELAEKIQSLKAEEKQEILEALEPKTQAYTREDAIKDINKLPQAKYIGDFDMHDWLDKVQEYDPGRLAWHVRRLGGIGGSEIGTLWMSLRDQYHPFHSCTDVVESKLLKQMPLAPEGNLQRGSMMEDPILRVKFRQEMTQKYAAKGIQVKFRDDLFVHFMNYKDADPKLSWLVGSPDDIIELDGKLVIVDYKAPTSGTIAVYSTYEKTEAPIYYEAQLHHYHAIGQKLGLPVADWAMLASLDYDKFTFDIREIKIRQEFSDELIDAGNFYWHEYLLKGQLPPPGNRKSFSKETELPEEYAEYARKYALLSTVMNMAKAERDQLQKVMKNIPTPIDLSVDVVVSGMVNIEAERVIDHVGLEQALKSLGVDTEPAHQKTDFDQKALLSLAKTALSVNDDLDEKLDSLRIQDEIGSIDVVDPYRLMQLAREQNLNLAPYIKSETAHLSLSRTKNGLAPMLREQLSQANYDLMSQILDGLSTVYDETQEHFSKQVQSAQKKPKPAV